MYLLDDSEEDLQLLRGQLETYQKGIIVGGSDVLTENGRDMDEIINRINDVAPTAIISRMAHGKQERCMVRSKELINAEVWLGISKDMALGAGKESLRRKFVGQMYRIMFHRRINHFKDGNEE